MEDFRNTLKKRSALWLLLLIVSVSGIGLFFVFGEMVFGMNVELRRSFGGMFGFLFIMSSVSLATIGTTLGDEKKLKEKYILSTDERNLNIEVKSSNVTLNIVMVCLFIGFIFLALFFDKDAATIPGVAFYGIWFIKNVVKSYYNKKM